MYRVVHETIGETVTIEQVSSIAEIPIYFKVNDCFKQVQQLEILKSGVVKIDGDLSSPTNFMLVHNYNYVNNVLKYEFVTSMGNLDTQGTFYINDNSILFEPGDEIKIITTLDRGTAVDLISALMIDFPVSLSSVIRNLDVKPKKMYRFSNIILEYYDDEQFKGFKAEFMVFRNGKLSSLKPVDALKIPIMPIPTFRNLKDMTCYFKKGPKYITCKFTSGDTFVPFSPNGVAATTLDTKIKNFDYDVEGVETYYSDIKKYRYLQPLAENILYTISSQKPEGIDNYDLVVTDLNEIKNEEYSFGYKDDLLNHHVNRLLVRFDEIQKESASKFVNALISEYILIKQDIDNLIQSNRIRYLDHRGAVASGIKIQVPNAPYLDASLNVQQTDLLLVDVKKTIEKIYEYDSEQTKYCKLIDEFLSRDYSIYTKKLADYWYNEFDGIKTTWGSYQGWKCWGAELKKNKNARPYTIKMDYNRPFSVMTSKIGRSPVMKLVYKPPIIEKWGPKHDKQSDNYNSLIQDIQKAAENSFYKLLSEYFNCHASENQYEFTDLLSINVTSRIDSRVNMIPHDLNCEWYEWPRNKQSDVNITIEVVIVFKMEDYKVVEIEKSSIQSNEVKSKIAKKFGLDENLSFNELNKSNIGKNVQIALDTDVELQEHLNYIKDFLKKIDNKKVVVKSGNKLINTTESKEMPIQISTAVSYDGEGIVLNEVIANCTTEFDGVNNYSIGLLLKDLGISYTSEQGRVIRDYSQEVQYEKDETLTAGLITAVFQNVTI